MALGQVTQGSCCEQQRQTKSVVQAAGRSAPLKQAASLNHEASDPLSARRFQSRIEVGQASAGTGQSPRNAQPRLRARPTNRKVPARIGRARQAAFARRAGGFCRHRKKQDVAATVWAL